MPPAESHWRRDPLSGRWVLVAPERGERPHSHGDRSLDNVASDCPFCEGNESRTPHELLSSRLSGSANQPGWQVRVVPNRFPALRPSHSTVALASLGDSLAGVGCHEVVIEHPVHHTSLLDLSVDHIGLVMAAYRERTRALSRMSPIRSVLVFRNQGRRSGASQDHVHSQILATTLVPPLLQQEYDQSLAHWDRQHRCLLCDVIRREEAVQIRCVEQSSQFVVLCPFASRFALECWIVPRDHQSQFDLATDHQLSDLAGVLRRQVQRLEAVGAAESFNFYIHGDIAGESSRDDRIFHWHLELTPRIEGLAGFEIGGGAHINPMSPEQAAELLRGGVKKAP